jgi:uncharacterized protein YbaP (TraB family)
MKRRLAMLALPLLAGLPAAAQLMAQDATVSPAPAPKRSMFWKVSSGEHVAYLLGSIHFGSQEMYPLPREIEDAFDRSAVLLVEADLNHLDLQKMKALAEYAGDDTLWNHVSKQVRQRLEEFCGKYGFRPAAIARLKPWVVAVMVSTIPKARSGMQAGLGIDKYFLDRAEKAGKRVVEIESAESLTRLSGITGKMLEKSLAASADQDVEESGRRTEKIWMSGDADLLDRTLREEMSKDPIEVVEANLEQRNPHMAEVVERYLKGQEQVFVVVGTGHMVGRIGLVKLLEKRGYQVEQVAIWSR